MELTITVNLTNEDTDEPKSSKEDALTALMTTVAELDFVVGRLPEGEVLFVEDVYPQED